MNVQEIYDRFGERIYHYLSIKLGSLSDAEDVLQEVFYRLSRFSIRIQLVRNPLAFVFKTARNEANRYLSRRIRNLKGCRQYEEFNEIIQNVISGPNLEDEETVARALAQLPDEQREVIVLKYFEELTFQEIAAVSGISMNTITSRYRYGMEKLRSNIEEGS